jgi:hypothetical protein
MYKEGREGGGGGGERGERERETCTYCFKYLELPS